MKLTTTFIVQYMTKVLIQKDFAILYMTVSFVKENKRTCTVRILGEM